MRTSGKSVVRWSDQSSSVGQLARQLGQAPGKEIGERGAGHVDVAPAAIDEIHRHAERIVDVARKAHARLEHEGQEPRAIAIGVAPHLAAHRQEAVGPAFRERRAGEDRRCHRLQRQRHAEFLDHVRLVGEVEVHLDGGGAIHHVEAALADGGHVARHHLVALLGHARRFVQRPVGREADAEEADAQRRADVEALAADACASRRRPRARSAAGRRTARTVRPAPARRCRPASPSGRLRAMMLSPSMIGSQPKRAIRLSISARTPRGPA